MLTQFLKHVILHAPGLSLIFLYLPYHIPVGCISVFMTLDALLSSLSKYRFIYLRVGGERKEDEVF